MCLISNYYHKMPGFKLAKPVRIFWIIYNKYRFLQVRGLISYRYLLFHKTPTKMVFINNAKR